MVSLTLIRHGQSTYNLANLFTGNLDVPLTPVGETEALMAGQKLAGIQYNITYTSMLLRAQETLRIVLKTIGQTGIPVIKDAALNERRYGDLQGLNKDETAKKYGIAQVELWRRSYDIRPPGGESLADTFNRVVPYYQSAIAPSLQAGKNVLVVAHGNSLRSLMMYLENISREDIVKTDLPTAAPRRYEFDENLRLLDVRYL